MNAIDTLFKITNQKLVDTDLKYCLVTKDKIPKKIDGTNAKPNEMSDFVDIDELMACENLNDFAGIGISIQASNVCAIDVDNCFAVPNALDTANAQAFDILNRFKDVAYCEFSFSGTGLRILFKHSIIEDYSKTYYIKNKTLKIEYYQPSSSYRYVTVTGNTIYNNEIINIDDSKIVELFLNDYMQKKTNNKKRIEIQDCKENMSLDILKNKIKILYLKNSTFQDLWFGVAPGSGKNESELDFQLLAMIFENITQNEEQLKALFELSPYFSTKDKKHVNKWVYQNNRYFKYLYEQLQRRVS